MAESGRGANTDSAAAGGGPGRTNAPVVFRPAHQGVGAERERKKSRKQSDKIVKQRLEHTHEVLSAVIDDETLVHPGEVFASLRSKLQHIVHFAATYRLTPTKSAVRLIYSDLGYVSSSSSSSIDSGDDGAGGADAASSDGGHDGEAVAAAAVPAPPTPQQPEYMFTKGFVRSVHESCAFEGGAVVLQIIATERRKKMHSRYSSGGKWQSQLRVNVTDGEHKMLAVVATHARAVCGDYFNAGAVIKVTQYTCVQYKNNDDPETLGLIAMLISAAALVGVAPVPDRLIPGFAASADWGGIVLPSSALVPNKDDGGGGGGSGGSGGGGSSDADDDEEEEEEEDGAAGGGDGTLPAAGDTAADDSDVADAPAIGPDGFCNGELCSIEGLVTSHCYLRRIDHPRLENIREACYFATKAVEEMENKHKRFCLYWWWATNVYCIRGKGMRAELPACVVQSIRTLYPNPPGQPYTGFKPQ